MLKLLLTAFCCHADNFLKIYVDWYITLSLSCQNGIKSCHKVYSSESIFLYAMFQFVKKEEPQPEPPAEEAPREGGYQVALDSDLYDEEIIGEFTRMRDHYESRLEALESHFAEASAIAKERHFDNLVDSLGHVDLFGATDKETAQEKQRREDLFVEVETYLRGREALGRPAELNDTILSRIARSLFTEELGKKELKKQK